METQTFEPPRFVPLKVRNTQGGARKALFATRDIARLIEWGDETLLVLRRTAVALDGSEAGRSTYVVPAPIEKVVARVTGVPALPSLAERHEGFDRESYRRGWLSGHEAGGYPEGYLKGFAGGYDEGFREGRRSGGAR